MPERPDDTTTTSWPPRSTGSRLKPIGVGVLGALVLVVPVNLYLLGGDDDPAPDPVAQHLRQDAEFLHEARYGPEGGTVEQMVADRYPRQQLVRADADPVELDVTVREPDLVEIRWDGPDPALSDPVVCLDATAGSLDARDGPCA